MLKANVAWISSVEDPRNLPIKFGQIGSVTAEIFLIIIWTNAAKTNVAWTNVTLTVEICSRCSQEPIFTVSSKS